MKNNLENLRKELKITQGELAEKLEVSRQTINSIENGRYEPSITLAFKLSIFFNKKIEEIFIYGEWKIMFKKNKTIVQPIIYIVIGITIILLGVFYQ